MAGIVRIRAVAGTRQNLTAELYFIAYLAKTDEILIVRILDGRQDWAEYLRS
jgi:plasmid stabilization system protein ParE